MAYKVIKRDPYSDNPKWKFCFRCKTESQAWSYIHQRNAEYDEDEYKVIYPGPSGYPSDRKFNNPNNKYFGKKKEYCMKYKLYNIINLAL